MTANILIVDDEDLVLKSLSRVFRPEGYNVYQASSGQEALEIMENTPIDIILTDQRMPEMTGTQLLKIVKERWPDTMRLIISGYADVEAVLKAINVGEVYRFITKPWEDNSLRALVRRAIEQGKIVKIFLNLIEYLREKSPFRDVEATSYTEQGRIYAEIKDHGTGMSEKQILSMLKTIFDFFDSASDNHDLPMLSNIIYRQEGKLSFTTEMGQGAQLVIDMPIEEEQGT